MENYHVYTEQYRRRLIIIWQKHTVKGLLWSD